MKDLAFFISIIAVFFFAFGITTQATMYPNNNAFSYELVKSIINKAYWPIYGEMKIFDEFNNENCDQTEEGCPDIFGVEFSYFALMAYMMIANVLLVNLLIAMFRFKFFSGDGFSQISLFFLISVQRFSVSKKIMIKFGSFNDVD